MNKSDHILSIKKQLQERKTFDLNQVYDDWFALLKFNREEVDASFVDEASKDIELFKVVSEYVDKLEASELKVLSKIISQDETLSFLVENSETGEERTFQHVKAGFIWVEGIELFFQTKLNELIDKEANSAEYFDERDFKIADVLRHIHLIILKLLKTEEKNTKKLVVELDKFVALLEQKIPSNKASHTRMCKYIAQPLNKFVFIKYFCK